MHNAPGSPDAGALARRTNAPLALIPDCWTNPTPSSPRVASSLTRTGRSFGKATAVWVKRRFAHDEILRMTCRTGHNRQPHGEAQPTTLYHNHQVAYSVASAAPSHATNHVVSKSSSGFYPTLG